MAIDPAKKKKKKMLEPRRSRSRRLHTRKKFKRGSGSRTSKSEEWRLIQRRRRRYWTGLSRRGERLHVKM